jgi:hypothetical protein
MTDTQKLWISTAETPYGNEYGVVAVIAATREEAIAKAATKVEESLKGETYVPNQRYVRSLLDGLSEIREVQDEVHIDWTPPRRRR